MPTFPFRRGTFLGFSDYEFNISDLDAGELAANRRSDLHSSMWWVFPEKIEDLTVNLAAPILIN
jgi:flagellar assembly factor FliW